MSRLRRNPLTRDWADNTVVWLESSPYSNLRAVRKIIDELHEASTDAEFRAVRKKIERLFQTLESRDQLVEGDDADAITQALLEGTLGLAEHGIARPERPRRARQAQFDEGLPPGYEAAADRAQMTAEQLDDLMGVTEGRPSLRLLRSEAALAAGARGHNIEWSPPRYYAEDRSYTQVGGCIHCHREVFLNTRPPPNGATITGEAVALNCDHNVDATVMSERALISELIDRGWDAQRTDWGGNRGISIHGTKHNIRISLQAGDGLYSTPRADGLEFYTQIEVAAQRIDTPEGQAGHWVHTSHTGGAEPVGAYLSWPQVLEFINEVTAIADREAAIDEMTGEEEEHLVDLSDELGGDELTLLQGWYSGQIDPLYALQSSGTLELGRFDEAISNLESIIYAPNADDSERAIGHELIEMLREARRQTLAALRQGAAPEPEPEPEIVWPWFHQGYLKALVRGSDELLEVELPEPDADFDEWLNLVNPTLQREVSDDCNSFLTSGRNYHDMGIIHASTAEPPSAEEFGEAFWVARQRYGGYNAFGGGLGYEAVAAGHRLEEAAGQFGAVALVLDDEGRLR